MRKKQQSSMLILIPAFNEEKNILQVTEELDVYCPEIDYIVINDGSSDHTSEICKQKGIDVLDLPVNLGLAGAFRAGMRYAVEKGYKYALQFDGDGQHCAEYISFMFSHMLEKKCNIVIGSRYIDEKRGISMRNLGSRIISFLIFITTGRYLKDPTSGMRLYDFTMMKEIVGDMNYTPEPDMLAVLIRKGATVDEVTVRMRERIYGNSYLTLGKSLKYMFHISMSILIVNWMR